MVATATSSDHLMRPSVAADRAVRDREAVLTTYRKKYHDLLARYDAAQPSMELQRHLANADYLSPKSSASYSVRRRLRSFARYEFQENNPYGKGLLLKHSGTLVGRCPRVEVEAGGDAANDFIETQWESWCQAVRFGAKFRTGAMSKTCDGEWFGLMVTNPGVSHGVQLDVVGMEADQVTTPSLPLQPNYIDGIKFDSHGNPEHYDVLDQHPGDADLGLLGSMFDPRKVPAEDVLHWFREDRPGQKRGVSEVAPALPLGAMMRRFTIATVAAAETAAEHTAVMKTNASAVDTSLDKDGYDPFQVLDIELRQLLQLPEGWDIGQFKAEHPATTFEMFDRVMTTMMSQCLVMPGNMARGDFSDDSFAGGRLGPKLYQQYIGLERYDAGCGVLRKLFAAWYRELRLWASLTGAFAGVLPPFDAIRLGWHFDGADHGVDPNREAAGEHIRLGNGSLTFAELLGGRGRDWRRSFRQLATELGLSFEELQEKIREKLFEAPNAAENAPGEDPRRPDGEPAGRTQRKGAA